MLMLSLATLLLQFMQSFTLCRTGDQTEELRFIYLLLTLSLVRFLFLFLQDVGNFGDLALAMITLANVILKTEEIYLVNHIKLFLKNNPTAERRLQASLASTTKTTTTTAATASALHWQDEAPSTSSAAAAARAASSRVAPRPTISEIYYFAKVLSEKLLACLDALLGLRSGSDSDFGSSIGISPGHSSPSSHAYCQLAGRFVNALHNVCCRSRHKDALQSVFRLVLAESEFLCKYYNLLLMSAEGSIAGEALEPVLLGCLKLLLSMRMLEPMVLLGQASELPLKWTLQRAMLDEVCRGSAVSMGCSWSHISLI